MTFSMVHRKIEEQLIKEKLFQKVVELIRQV